MAHICRQRRHCSTLRSPTTRLLPTISNPQAHYKLSSSTRSPYYLSVLQVYLDGGSALAPAVTGALRTRNQTLSNSTPSAKSSAICVLCSTSEAEYLSYSSTIAGKVLKASHCYFSCLHVLA